MATVEGECGFAVDSRPMGTVAYGLLAKVHWPARERAIRGLVARHFLPAEANRREMIRLLDVGCGPGWLAETAASLGADYLGLDPDPPRSRSDVVEGRAADVAEHLEARDVVIVNGTAHHLDDVEFESLLAAARGAAGVIVCDHARDETTSARSRFLQSIDRGRHVRDFSVFASLAGWRRLETTRFPIRIAGIAAWDYFASAYRAEARA